jgi:phosphoribosylformimino-5-aminoimidazole carboxamide ribotide isomerase
VRILPVLDLKDGVVVRGVAGRRQEYRPIVSRLTASADPVDVARAFRDAFGLAEIYLADLDAIGGCPPALPVYAALQALNCRLWVDAGVRKADTALPLAAAGVERLVIGLETVAGPDVLEDLCRTLGGGRVVFSLDLNAGKPLGDLGPWGGQAADGDAGSIAARAVAAGVGALIVLDLACVGIGSGTGTEDLCTRLAAAHPDVEVIAGGGIRSANDLRTLRQCGVRGILIASALHDGSLTAADLAALEPSRPA